MGISLIPILLESNDAKLGNNCVMIIRKLSFLLALMVGAAACPALAQGGAPVVYEDGTDVVFIVDQSGSMSGSSVHPKANDPAGLRADLLNDLVVRLFGGSSRSLAMGEGRSYRLAVIEFGDSARIGLDWFVVKAIDDQSRSEAAQLAMLRQRYCDKLNTNVNLGNTNHLDAVKLTIGQFEKIDWGRDTTVTRDLAVVLITDGQSYVSSPPYFARGAFNSANYRRDLIRKIGNLLDVDRHPKPDFVVVGLADKIHGSGEWSNSRSMWERQANEVYSVQEPDSLYRALDDLASRLTGFRSIVADDRLEVPCYVAKLRLRVYHGGPMSHFALKDPEGRRVQLAARQVAEGARFRVYDLVQPIPGVWTLEGNRRSYQVLVDVHYQKTSLLTPVPPDPEVPSNPLRFRWLVQTTDGVPFQAKTGCGLEVITLVESDAGERDTVPMRLDPSTPGVFEGERDWQPGDPGDYSVQLSGFSPLESGNSMLVFGSKRIKVVVSARQPLVGEVLTPSLVRWSWGKAYSEIRVKMSSLDPTITVPSVSAISSNPDNLISFLVFNANGDLVQDRTTMTGLPNSSPAEFTTELKLERDYSALDWLGVSLLLDDDLVVRFDVNPEQLDPEYGIYGFGRESFEDFEFVVESQRNLLTDLPVALALMYILLNVLLLLYEFVLWGLVLATNYVAGIRRMRLFHRQAFWDTKLHRNIKGRHLYTYGKVPWTVFEKVFVLRGWVMRWIADSGKIPFLWIVEHETWPLEGFKLWRRPFNREARMMAFPETHPNAAPDILQQERRLRETVYELDGQRASRLPHGLGEFGLDVN